MASDNGLLFCPPLNGKESVLLYRKQGHADKIFPKLTSQQQTAAGQFIQHWQQTGVSRYNRYRDVETLPAHYVLVVLQARLSSETTALILAKAQQLAKESTAIVLVCHDQHDLCRLPTTADKTLVQVLPSKVHHARLLANALAVVTANSWLGFEALLWNKKVYSFLPSFYVGLSHYCGLPQPVNTAIDLPQGYQLQSQASLQQWVWQLFFVQARIASRPGIEPTALVDSSAILSWLAWQRLQRHRFAPELYAIGFNRIWRPVVSQFLQGSKVHFVGCASKVPANAEAISWGFKPLPGLDMSVKLTRLEDGFLRSVGLGAQFVRPLSWVADTTGLYFDATAPSDLELLLAQHSFSQDQLQQAEQLISELNRSGISKYNTGSNSWQRPATTKKVILVPGQVESDASIARGAPDIKQNMALLKAVRQANPDAWLIYKPHPDVLAGARASGQNEHQALDYCDQQVTNCSIGAMFNQVDEVHVLTSLAGFEALIRGVKVTCYGIPFYAGWGLTTDLHYCSRRGRKLSLQQLVAATLLLYPLYLCRHSGYYSTALATLADLQQWRQEKPNINTKLWQWLRWGLNKIVKPK